MAFEYNIPSTSLRTLQRSPCSWEGNGGNGAKIEPGAEEKGGPTSVIPVDNLTKSHARHVYRFSGARAIQAEISQFEIG